MNKTNFITITGINHYYGKKPFEIGRVIKLIKEPDNEYDDDAIYAYLPFIEKIGYVANSTHTVYDGTVSASRLYDRIGDYAYAKIMFITHSSAIAHILDKNEVEKIVGKPAESDSKSKATESQSAETVPDIFDTEWQ